ncbi:MAG: DegT/DnrJ/EryC1/StrS family aminotransferase [Candidatus Ornithobacterium hominis]|nr:DegT/DnrJ/EryC1/StrS family aminotransferase [Candidatus Ornithobacterium hominis]MCT7903751.1 DegT/DnrJ/EryC1/StrS family aminotransferase [Candidatus Ornithobacterium hominis]
MEKIQMVDLVSQYQKIKSEIDKKVIEVMESSAYINGPEVKAFEKELADYLEVKHVIACANGTDALQVALMSLGLEPGDEVITSNFTFAATAEVIDLLKLKSVLVDVDPETFNINPKELEKAISPKTKAIIPVHLFGQCANMEAILEIAKKHDLAVIEDTAQAMGSDFTFSNGETKKAGTMGHLGCTSFFPSKNLGCFGDGGAIFTNNDDLAYRIRGIANHGMYERYYHDEIGVNSRLDSMQAAILRVKLPHLEQYNKARRWAANEYDKRFEGNPNISIPKRSENSTHVFHQYTLKIKNADRNLLQKYLTEKEIPAMIYYPVPLHQQKAYNRGAYADEQFPITMDLVEQVISLPMHSELSISQIEKISTNVLNFFNE